MSTRFACGPSTKEDVCFMQNTYAGEFEKDPDVLPMNDRTAGALNAYFPEWLGLLRDDDGAIAAWSVIFPVGIEAMDAFVAGALTERELFARAMAEDKKEALYFCGVMVIPEMCGKGLAKELVTAALAHYRETYGFSKGFAWIFSEGGLGLFRSFLPAVQRPESVGERMKFDLYHNHGIDKLVP